MSNKQKLVSKIDEQGKRFSIFTTEDATTFYSDGLASIKGGPAISKLEFFVTEEMIPLENGEVEEKRVIRLTVAIPTLQLLQGISQIIFQTANFAPQIESSIEVLKNETSKQLKNLSGTTHVNP